MDFTVILAQTDALSGGSGWAGASLLGAVLAWLLFKHLPAKDQQIFDMIESRQKALDAKDAAMDKTVKAVTDHCKEELVLVTDRFERWITTLEIKRQGGP